MCLSKTTASFRRHYKSLTGSLSGQLLIVAMLITVFHLQSYAQTSTPCNLSPFGDESIEPAFQVDGAGENVDTIDFWEAPDVANTLMFVTAKDNSLIEVWKYPFEDNEQSSLVHSTFSNSNVNGVIVDQETDLLYVSIGEPSNTVSVFTLPDLTFVHNFNKQNVELAIEPNLALLKLPNGDKQIFLSSETTVYIHEASSGNYLGEFTPEKGLETMTADNYHQVIYIPDENDRTGVYAYHPNGDPFERNGSNNFGNNGIFDEDAEGIWLYRCTDGNGADNGNGLIVVSDQRESLTDFEVFDRITWEHLGTFNIDGVANTDGIASFQTVLPDYPYGIFAAIHDDSETAGVGWHDIFDAIGAVVAINDEATVVSDYQVHANYPNPFNPSTTIVYQIPKSSMVKLTIYNIFGQQVRTLVNELKQAGEFQTVWDGLDNDGYSVSSGIYIYEFATPEFRQAQKMTLMR